MPLRETARKELGLRLRRKIHYSLFRQKWNIAVTPHSVAVVAGLKGAQPQQQALTDLRWMPERRDMFAADPFIATKPGDPGEFLVFYEHYPWRTGRGRIGCVSFRADSFGASKIVLDSPHHLSYPHVIKHEGEQGFIPEHSASGDLSLYRLDESGDVRTKNTLSGHKPLVDSTFLFDGGKIWLFATHAGPMDNTELFIYFSDELPGPWKMHAQNPVKIDRSNARPAGSFIRHGGEIFRPAQDCSTHYGSRVIINKVTLLTEEAFEETPVSDIRPLAGSRYNYGLHTISGANGHTAIDGARMESSIHPIFDRLGDYVRTRA